MSGQIEFSVEGDQRKSHFPILFINFKSHVKTFCAAFQVENASSQQLPFSSSLVISSHLKAWLSSSKRASAQQPLPHQPARPSLSNEELIPSFVSAGEHRASKSFFPQRATLLPRSSSAVAERESTVGSLPGIIISLRKQNSDNYSVSEKNCWTMWSLKKMVVVLACPLGHWQLLGSSFVMMYISPESPSST